MYTYRYGNEAGTLIVRSDGAHIPVDEDNTDYRLLIETEEPIVPYAPPEPPAPPSVSKRQLKLWLVYNGYPVDAVPLEIAKLPEPERTFATIEYEDASSYSPTHPTLIMVAQALGIADIAQAAREAAEL